MEILRWDLPPLSYSETAVSEASSCWRALRTTGTRWQGSRPSPSSGRCSNCWKSRSSPRSPSSPKRVPRTRLDGHRAPVPRPQPAARGEAAASWVGRARTVENFRCPVPETPVRLARLNPPALHHNDGGRPPFRIQASSADGTASRLNRAIPSGVRGDSLLLTNLWRARAAAGSARRAAVKNGESDSRTFFLEWRMRSREIGSKRRWPADWPASDVERLQPTM